eukprot:15454765-Alexandrium_andersonii.AAC.2
MDAPPHVCRGGDRCSGVESKEVAPAHHSDRHCSHIRLAPNRLATPPRQAPDDPPHRGVQPLFRLRGHRARATVQRAWQVRMEGLQHSAPVRPPLVASQLAARSPAA